MADFNGLLAVMKESAEIGSNISKLETDLSAVISTINGAAHKILSEGECYTADGQLPTVDSGPGHVRLQEYLEQCAVVFNISNGKEFSKDFKVRITLEELADPESSVAAIKAAREEAEV